MPEAKFTKGIVAGALGGVVGSVVLEVFILGARSFHENKVSTRLDQLGPSHRVANRVFRKLAGRELTPDQREKGGRFVHYAFGAFVGGIYGGVAEYAAWTTAGLGSLFGCGVFLAADESSMPALGLSNKPWEESAQAQAEHLAAHLAFGVTTEIARRALRRSR